MNIKTIEKRNFLKIFNHLNFANQNKNNKDIYYYIKYIVTLEIDDLQFAPEDKNKLITHRDSIKNEILNAGFDISKFDPTKYSQLVSDYLNKLDFRKVDTDNMYKCKDLLEIDVIKNDLYNKRMDFFNKRLPPTFQNSYNPITYERVFNPNNSQNNNNVNNTKQPVNPFDGINYGNNSPYGNYTQVNNSNNNTNNNYNNPNNYNNTNNINNTNNNNYNNYNNTNNNYNNNNFVMNKKVMISEDLKNKIIEELRLCGDELNNGRVDKSQKHGLDAVLLFNQVFKDN